MSQFVVICPNNGACGHPKHEVGSANYQQCLAASTRSGSSAQVGRTSVAPSLSGSKPAATMQTKAPLVRVPANGAQENAWHLINNDLIMDQPYQRGSVWGTERKQNLIRSMLSGIPTGMVFLNERSGPSGLTDAIVDGKQRIEAMRDFRDSKFSVPASWFPEDVVNDIEETDDGPYVTFEGLAPGGQARFTRCSLNVYRTSLATEAEESDLFDLINYGGVPQGESDLD